ncbi:TonB-dependent receptor [Shewanella sp. 10N.286.45.A1]|uniref:TonB-dependent receptor domain-containing protein n=1 Tax=Shewanella sp. 10N.286.45.A1 TaxID=3229694 RepID=UPI00354D53C1
MYKNNLLANSVRLALVSGAMTAAFAAPAVLAAEESTVERIEVTGSRLKRTDLETTVPITVLSREDILQTGAINVADVLNQSPVAFAGSDQSNSAFTTSAVGLNTTALRNLSDERTLVLVNGRRFVSGKSPSDGYAVDLNSIPTSMIERIEILKSASSAIYGSDAVAGVVNIITRKDFEGVEINAQAGTSGEGDRNTKTVSFTTGGNWGNGNAWVSLGYDEDDGIKSSDRDFSNQDIGWILDDNGNEVIGPIESSYPPEGRITYKDLNDLDEDGDPITKKLNADGTPYSGNFNRAQYRQLVTPLNRKYAAAGLTQEINDDVSVFTEINWNSTSTDGSTIEPTPLHVVNDIWLKDRNGTAGMDVNSPLIPEELRAQLIAGGVTNLNETTFVRRMVELGARSTDVERDTIRVATGFDWAISDTWSNNSYFSWGKTNQLQENGGQVNIERAAQALDVIKDAEGNLICANEQARLQGCTPLNLFGGNTISPEAAAYVFVPAKAAGQTEQFVLSTSFSGEVPLELPGGNIGLSVGGEYREETGSYSPGDMAQLGASSTNKSAPTYGKLITKDIYIETLLPLLDNLELDLAARYGDHSITGGDVTWNAGIKYSPFDTFSVRASAATAIRTPNISDLFGGRGETFASVSDPCSGVTATTAGNVADNCRSISAINDRIVKDGTFELTQAEKQGTGGTTGGSPDVKAETAETYSVGAIWQVIDDLSLTVDYYNVAIDDAITSTSRSTVMRRCFEVSPTDFDPSCAGASVRNEDGALTSVDSGTGNENQIDTSGIDADITYSMDLGPGTFSTQLVWNYTIEYVITGIESGEAVDYVGQVLTPEHRANLNLAYGIDDFSFAWRMRYWDEAVDSINGENFNFNSGQPLTVGNEIDAVVYHDINARYNFSNGIEAFVGVKNLFDKQPPLLPQGTVNGGTGINTASEAYDVTGRYFYAGVNFKF